MIAASIFSGFLAGGDADRYIVEVPAWRHISILNWLEYSRHADLGSGLIFYPVEAIGSFILLLASLIICVVHKNVCRYSAFIVYIATLFATAGLILTFFAAPIMLSLRTIKNDPVLVQHAFDRFHLFGVFRAIAQVLSFIGCIWALGNLFINSSTSNIKNEGDGK